MGFSTIAASVVMFAALLFFSSTIANTYFESQRDTDRNEKERRDRLEFERGTSFDITDGDHVLTTLTLEATNTGTTTLDTDRLYLLVDGVWRTDDIIAITIEGNAAFTHWSPDLDLVVTALIFGTPGRAVLVSETGYSDTWGAL